MLWAAVDGGASCVAHHCDTKVSVNKTTVCVMGTLLAALGASACAQGAEICGPGTKDVDGLCVPEAASGDGTSGGGAAGTGGAGTPVCTGGSGAPPAGLVSIHGSLNQLVIDACGARVYLSNTSQNQIEVFDVATGALGAPILVGSQPFGFDVTPDNTRLYVANRGGENISVVDLAAGLELKKINVPAGFSGDTPLSLAITSSGKALFSTTFAGSGFGGRMLSLDLASEAVTLRTDFFGGGGTTEATVLQASADRGTIAAVAGDISSAPVFVYRTATDTFGPEHDLNGFIDAVTVNRDGTRILVDGTYVLDGNLDLLGTIPGGGGGTAAFAPDGETAYRDGASGIEVLDTTHFLVIGSLPLDDSMVEGGYGGMVGKMAVSPDGTWLAVITDHGVSFVGLP